VQVETKRRLIAFTIGLGTITAGLFAWRAGQIGSSANFDDRQSISQQVDLENVRIDVTVEASRQARQYDRYVSEFAVADGYDDDADALRTAGQEELALLAAAEAQNRREAATQRAFDSGVFDPAALANSQQVTEEPRPFDLEQRIQSLYTERTTGLASTGELDPQALADASDASRARVRTLIQWVGVLLTAVVCLTAAQVTVSSRVRAVAVPLGLALMLIGIVGGLTRGFWA
jgi:hypothetical protein